MGGLRYANIGIAVGAAFILLGVLACRHAADGVIQAIGLMGFALGAVVYVALDERDKRRRGRQ